MIKQIIAVFPQGRPADVLVVDLGPSGVQPVKDDSLNLAATSELESTTFDAQRLLLGSLVRVVGTANRPHRVSDRVRATSGVTSVPLFEVAIV